MGEKNTSKKNSYSNNSSFPVVGIGASAGGLDALKKLFENLPENTNIAYIIIQHLDPHQESMLSQIISRYTKTPTSKIEDNTNIQPNHIYTNPSGKTVTLNKNILKLEPKDTTQKTINAFLSSLGHEKKIHSIGVILSGTGNDGTQGLKDIISQGGITIAQDPKTAQYPEMPQSAISTQAVHYILSPQQIAQRIVEISKHPIINNGKPIEPQEQEEEEKTSLQKILFLLKSEFDVNFDNYKKSTINRRIDRRMILNDIKDSEKYLHFLKDNKNELQSLFDDLLINVTTFFREPETFDLLKEKVFPVITQQNNKTIRIWIPGCSTGEEVYSTAITIVEYLEEKTILDSQIQIFGTDVNNKNVEKARQGIYRKIIEENVSDNRLKRFFTSTNEGYQIKKQIRDMCIFAKHDLTKDPPFSNLDLIVCRNLLIYLDQSLQQKLIPNFHYALNNNGFLVLGQSESIGGYSNLFGSITSKGTIFKKKEGQSKIGIIQATPPNNSKRAHYYESRINLTSTDFIEKEADKLLLSQYVPASFVINGDGDVVVFHGKIEPYISISSGKASLNLSNIISMDLKPTVQTALYRAKKKKESIKETVRIKKENQIRIVQIQVDPLNTSKNEEPFFVVLFKEISKTKPESKSKDSFSEDAEKVKDHQIRELSEDLASTKKTLQTLLEEKEATNEELRSALEEAQSSNEELMSTNEEMETTKEELQSTNEELKTLNDELRDRNQYLDLLNDDLKNLMDNLDTAVVILDDDFRIRRFTDSARNLLRLTSNDFDVPITSIRLGIPLDNLGELLSEVVDNLKTVRTEIITDKGKWFQMRIRPYLSHDKRVKGAILSLADISEIKKLQEEKQFYTEDLEHQVKEQSGKLVNAERMASIGKTAGMVGHDIRNPLQTIVSELYMAKQELEDASCNAEMKKNMLESIGSIEEQIFYINKIVQDLQDYSRPTKPQFFEVDVEKTINDVLFNLPIPESIAVFVNVELDFPKPELDRTFLQRILTNLINNAVQAMPKGGDLTVTASCVGDEIELKVMDSGEGISMEAKAKLFSPLFTTKAKGQGFGLAVVKRLTEAMQGKVTFVSEPGKGTTFTLNFPIKQSSPNSTR